MEKKLPNYRRANTPGGCYFFTLVTDRRQPVLTHPDCRHALRRAIISAREQHPFTIEAWVLLPDHLHAIWTLPVNDADFSLRWGKIKASVTRQLRASGLCTDSIWQKRFWEHEIRDESDYRQHMDYIHYNPVKHGFVQNVSDWPHSTFHRQCLLGTYPKEWGQDVQIIDGNFGE
jgi:putative transposase